QASRPTPSARSTSSPPAAMSPSPAASSTRPWPASRPGASRAAISGCGSCKGRENGAFRRHRLDWAPAPTGELPMAKPNYSFEKRQREIAKKKKQDDKAAKKQAARDAANPASEDGENAAAHSE